MLSKLTLGVILLQALVAEEQLLLKEDGAVVGYLPTTSADCSLGTFSTFIFSLPPSSTTAHSRYFFLSLHLVYSLNAKEWMVLKLFHSGPQVRCGDQADLDQVKCIRWKHAAAQEDDQVGCRGLGVPVGQPCRQGKLRDEDSQRPHVPWRTNFLRVQGFGELPLTRELWLNYVGKSPITEPQLPQRCEQNTSCAEGAVGQTSLV